MKRWLWGGAALLIAVIIAARLVGMPTINAQTENITTTALTPVATEAHYMSNLPDYGAAPELNNTIWLNTDQALPLKSLGGKVVLLEMWTFECYNCLNTLPYVRAWYDAYADQGLVVIGNHYPEFSSEADLDNLRDALVRLDIRYPVAQDNDRHTWDAYANRYWPVMYLIDKNGHLRYQHIGEGAYDTTEANIRDLLREDYAPPAQALNLPQSLSVADDVSVRAVAGAQGADQAPIGVIHAHEAFVVRGEQDGWYQIDYQGQAGYVSAELVKVTAAVR
jgi:thiol-disulfide isomerase/thioredoxin